jgi:hypothetical protein
LLTVSHAAVHGSPIPLTLASSDFENDPWRDLLASSIEKNVEARSSYAMEKKTNYGSRIAIYLQAGRSKIVQQNKTGTP